MTERFTDLLIFITSLMFSEQLLNDGYEEKKRIEGWLGKDFRLKGAELGEVNLLWMESWATRAEFNFSEDKTA